MYIYILWVTGLLTGHCHLKGHLFKVWLTESPTFERCLEEDESATHILCDCEAIAYLRFRHLDHYFMEPGDYQDAPVSKILHFIRSVGLLEGWNRGGCTIDLCKVAVQGPIEAHPLFIHSYIHIIQQCYTVFYKKKFRKLNLYLYLRWIFFLTSIHVTVIIKNAC
jgi:hypothetical protein